MNNPINVLIGNLLSKNPRVANNPKAMEYLQVIQSGDSVRGQEIADNLCKTYGSSREEAVSNAKRFFNIH